MKTYRIIGLKNEKQTKRIKERFKYAVDEANIEIDFEHSIIQLPKDIDNYTISLISSFEQVSIVDEKELELHHHNDDHHHHHHHEIKINDSPTVQRNMLIVFSLNLFFFSRGIYFWNYI